MQHHSLTAEPRRGQGAATRQPSAGVVGIVGGCPRCGFYQRPTRTWLWWEERKGGHGMGEHQSWEKDLEGDMGWR